MKCRHLSKIKIEKKKKDFKQTQVGKNDDKENVPNKGEKKNNELIMWEFKSGWVQFENSNSVERDTG